VKIPGEIDVQAGAPDSRGAAARRLSDPQASRQIELDYIERLLKELLTLLSSPAFRGTTIVGVAKTNDPDRPIRFPFRAPRRDRVAAL